MTVSEKKRAKRIKIMEAAYQLSCGRNFQSIAIDEVVHKAGIAKGTFYLYFKDRYDLIDQVIVHKGAQAIQTAWQALRGRLAKAELSLEEQIIYFLDELIAFMEQNRELLMLLNRNLSMNMQALLTQEENEVAKIVETTLQFYAEKTKITVEHARKLTYLVVNMVISVCYDAIINQQPAPMQEMRPILYASVKKILL